jgi:dipeptidase
MCDTHVILSAQGNWFAKNSDREPSESQYMEYHPRVVGDQAAAQSCSYIDVPQVANRHAYFLSRPSWLWGGEMGVNEKGVCIGNEAIFSKTKSLKPALLGMDLLRLALQRADSANTALAVITDMLAEHGQGGPAGFRNKSFHYDSSFLILDQQQCWKLETAGRHWVAKHYQRPSGCNIAVNISNAYTIGSDFDRCSAGIETFAQKQKYWDGKQAFNFAKAFDSKLMPWFAAAKQRQQQGQCQLAMLADQPISQPLNWADFAALLRQHKHPSQQPASGSNADRCMHAGGPIRQSQTTASLIVRIQEGDIRAAATGTSAPCLSIFRPFSFDAENWSLLYDPHHGQHSLWHEYEPIHRRAMFNESLRRSIKGDISLTEPNIFAALDSNKTSLATSLGQADLSCMEWQQRQLARAEHLPLTSEWSGYGYYWQRLNKKDHIQ